MRFEVFSLHFKLVDNVLLKFAVFFLDPFIISKILNLNNDMLILHVEPGASGRDSSQYTSWMSIR